MDVTTLTEVDECISEELVLMSAVYPDELVVSTCDEHVTVQVHVSPREEEHAATTHVECTVAFRLLPGYPNRPPEIGLSNTRGVSCVAELRRCLDKEAAVLANDGVPALFQVRKQSFGDDSW